MPTWILGISCFYHDAAAALLCDGRLVAAAGEERFTRVKHDPGFPVHAIDYVLKAAGIGIERVDHLGFYDKPMLKLERIMASHLQHFPRSRQQFVQAIPLWMKEKLSVRRAVAKHLGWKRKPILFAEHHVSHGASAFLCSPFQEAAILTVDGVGEWATTTQGVGRGNRLELDREIRFPHSLGLLYSAMTGYLGFKVNSAEYKVMGLAPYGEPRYVDRLEKVIDVAEDGSFRLDMRYFDFDFGLRMCNDAFIELMDGQPPRAEESKLEPFHKDLARSVQEITNRVMLLQAKDLQARTGMRNLCMAGGVALNCVANGHILREAGFEDIWVQPAAGDAGGALGVALWIHCMVLGNQRAWTMDRADWGPAFSESQIEEVLQRYGTKYTRLPDERAMIDTAVDHILDEKVVGWFQGRMEFGPRALGSRSILGDPRVTDMRDRINLKIKFREGFRPFAPSALEEKSSDWFDLRGKDSPYMLLVADVHPDKRVVPAITHVDGSARIQTVDRETSPLYHALVSEFDRRTGVPMLINTSFNVRGEPIICTPEDAILCFIRTHMDSLFIGPFLLRKAEQRAYPEIGDAREVFPLD